MWTTVPLKTTFCASLCLLESAWGESASAQLTAFVCLGWSRSIWTVSPSRSGNFQSSEKVIRWPGNRTSMTDTLYFIGWSQRVCCVRAFWSFTAYVDGCIPAVQLGSALLPSSTCCSLVTFPPLWLFPDSATPPTPATLFFNATKQGPPSSLPQSWHILLLCLHARNTSLCL